MGNIDQLHRHHVVAKCLGNFSPEHDHLRVNIEGGEFIEAVSHIAVPLGSLTGVVGRIVADTVDGVNDFLEVILGVLGDHTLARWSRCAG